MSEQKIVPLLQPSKVFATEVRGVRYDYYLTGPIGEAEDYIDLCNILRTATPQDEVIIRINSGGGSVSTGNMIINAINESEANVIGFIESDCGSMATFIFLACHSWAVSDAAEFFAHTCSYGSWGKEHENFAHAEFLRKQQHKMARKRYKYFLTEEEIDRILAGQDVYLDADEIMERLPEYSEMREIEFMESQENDGSEQVEHKTLEDMIEESVESVLNRVLDQQAAKEKKAMQKAQKKVKVDPVVVENYKEFNETAFGKQVEPKGHQPNWGDC